MMTTIKRPVCSRDADVSACLCGRIGFVVANGLVHGLNNTETRPINCVMPSHPMKTCKPSKNVLLSALFQFQTHVVT
eukprot:2799579-Amphidinium_carterae.1